MHYAINAKTKEVLKAVNDAICASRHEDMFLTIWLGILDTTTGKIVASNAGHEYPMVMQGGEKFEILKDKHSFVVGGMENLEYKEYEIQLRPGSKIFLYTDGVPEATDANNELFGMDRLVEALNGGSSASPEVILKNVRKSVDDFVKDAEQFDDLTMLCVEYKGTENN